MRTITAYLITAIFCVAIFCAAFCAAAAAAEPDIVIADFEGKDYGDWKATGDAFGPGPAQGTLPKQMDVSGFQGKGLVNSYFKGDPSTGTLTSPEFKIERKYINFLIGGGHHPGQTCINLLVDGKPALTATGPNKEGGGTERLDPCSWDVTKLKGKTAKIQIVDKARGGWGHINIDQIQQSDTKKGKTPKQEKPVVVNTDTLYDETYRPQFHFTPKINWTNDPNGLVYYDGEYHLFFQHNPTGIRWGNMTWGHAVSPDLMHWQQLDHAIHPDKLGTIFSGSAVVDRDNTAGFQTGDEKVIVCIYTSAGGCVKPKVPFTQSIAYSNDRGRTWTKYEKNPVLGHIAGSNRDPKVFWHTPTKKWIMALFVDRGRYALFTSPNLKQWTRLCDIPPSGGSECPDLFELAVDGDKNNKKWVFWSGNGSYLIGAFDGEKFTKEGGPFVSKRGANDYAAQTYSNIPDADGRRIQISWMAGGKYPGMPFNQQMSFPRVLTLRTTPEGIRLYVKPVKEIENLHEKEHAFSDVPLKPDENLLKDISGELFDIRAVIQPGKATALGFDIRGHKVEYSVEKQEISALGRKAPLPIEDGKITLQILADRSSLEVFGNDGLVSMCTCFLPRPENKKIAIYATGGDAKIVSLEVFELRSAWKKK